ncbi:DUF4158 domain-containing protein [Streptomyces sp. NEAU-Y11]|nr:DUF4158 domain-containing protein [Streptomyces sp. NEAU-Y11]MCP9213245.1 DUF4158 domain-containing protein [Streptomyces sp. NEAU-Y11]
MAVEFLSDQQAAQYAAFNGAPSRAELERYFFLDDSDLEKVQAKRRAHNRLGFAVQLTSVRYLGRFMPDPRQVLAEVAEYLAEQLGIADASCLKEYGGRDGTARTHAGEIQEAGGWRDFAEVRDELSEWLDARAWTTGDGPKSLFDAAGGWLRERRVLLPGASRLARLVGTVREAANNRLWDTLYGLLLTVEPGARVSELDRLRQGPVRISRPQMKWALQRAQEITAFGMGEVDVSAIPPRRLAELSRYGIDGKASLLRRHGDSRRLATLLATAVYLTSRAVDDALDLLEMLVATKLLARAERETMKEKLKTLPRVEPGLGKAGHRVSDRVRHHVRAGRHRHRRDHPARGGDAGGDVGAYRAGGAAARASGGDRRAVRADPSARRGRGMADPVGHPVRRHAAVSEAAGGSPLCSGTRP